MNSRWIAAVVGAGLMAVASPVAAAPGARIVGALGFRDRDRRVTPGDVERLLGGKRISISLRSGWDVVAVRLDRDGSFAADVAPGAWRLEWIDVGARAEVLATPLEFEARAGATTCAGRIELAYSDLESELGASAAGTVRVEGGCEHLPGVAGAEREVGRPFGRDSYHPPFGFPEIAEGIRTEGFFVDQEPGLRLSWAVPLRRPFGWIGNFVAVGGVSRHFASGGASDAFDAGAGFTPYWGAELTGGVRWERGVAREVAPWVGLRLGPPAYAFTVRADLRDGPVWSFGLELSAFHLLGRFL